VMTSNLIEWETFHLHNFERTSRYDSVELCRRGLTAFRQKIALGSINALSLSVRDEIRSCHRKPVQCLALEKCDFRYLLAGGLDGIVSLYDLEKSSSRAKGASTVTNVAASPQLHVGTSAVSWFPLDYGAFVSTGYDGLLKIWVCS
jgi:WD40 repeat protein